MDIDGVVKMCFEILTNPTVGLAVISASAMGIFTSLFLLNDDNQRRGGAIMLLLLIALVVFALFGIVRP